MKVLVFLVVLVTAGIANAVEARRASPPETEATKKINATVAELERDVFYYEDKGKPIWKSPDVGSPDFKKIRSVFESFETALDGV